MLTLLADEHILQTVVRGLRSRGIEVWTVSEVDLEGASDENVLAPCREHDLVLSTNDDLLSLVDGEAHPGLLFQTTQFAGPRVLIGAIDEVVDTVPEGAFSGRVFFVP